MLLPPRRKFRREYPDPLVRGDGCANATQTDPQPESNGVRALTPLLRAFLDRAIVPILVKEFWTELCHARETLESSHESVQESQE
jgi:hypothetical protein